MRVDYEQAIYESLVEGQKIADLVAKIKMQCYLDSDTVDWCEQIEERVDILFASAYDNAHKVWDDYTANDMGGDI
mgnify:CR=1 FL=1